MIHGTHRTQKARPIGRRRHTTRHGLLAAQPRHSQNNLAHRDTREYHGLRLRQRHARGRAGVSTLSLRVDRGSASFFMHERGSDSVGLAANTFHVLPAGEFQPIDVSPVSIDRGLDLWSTMCREYAEELLGHQDSAGRSGWSIDWEAEQPYCSLNDARAKGSVVPWFLGIGFDPLSWKPERLSRKFGLRVARVRWW
jgi:hypothetical protein